MLYCAENLVERSCYVKQMKKWCNMWAFEPYNFRLMYKCVFLLKIFYFIGIGSIILILFTNNNKHTDKPIYACSIIWLDLCKYCIWRLMCYFMTALNIYFATVVEDLFRRREPMPTMEAIYFIQPSKEKYRLIAYSLYIYISYMTDSSSLIMAYCFPFNYNWLHLLW